MDTRNTTYQNTMFCTYTTAAQERQALLFIPLYEQDKYSL